MFHDMMCDCKQIVNLLFNSNLAQKLWRSEAWATLNLQRQLLTINKHDQN